MRKPPTFYATASQNLILIHHLKDLLTRLEKEGLEILFFRGISLLGDVYPSMGERDMLDVDILVRERDFGLLKKVLKGMGLEEIEPGSFYKTGFALDVHTSFLNLSRTILESSCLRISIEDVFQKSVAKELDGIKIRIPCPVHLFISTAIHLQSHSFDSQKGWEDLVRIKRFNGLSDENILSEAERIGAARTLYYLSFLRLNLFPAWRSGLTIGERWILTRISKRTFNQNFGDLLFLFHSKRKIKSLKEIFFPQGFSLSILNNRMLKCLRLLKDTLFESSASKN